MEARGAQDATCAFNQHPTTIAVMSTYVFHPLFRSEKYSWRSICSQQQAQPTTNPPATVGDALDHAKRAFALRKYEQAVEHYATALELLFVPPFPLPPPPLCLSLVPLSSLSCLFCFILSCDGRLTSSNIDQRRTRKTRQRWQTSISRTERRCSRMPSRRIPSSARSGRVATRRRQRRQKVRSSPLKFCEAFVFS